jgi:hypothetical protein
MRDDSAAAAVGDKGDRTSVAATGFRWWTVHARVGENFGGGIP